ncbi:MAG: hypothetical protein Q4D79_09755 [Propionibacteriaceae bacterium]|nr:hypothetical protein [Propionibacteriaceae bacterium]
MGKRFIALLACIVLGLVGCGRSSEVRNDPNLDAQQILDKALEYNILGEGIGPQDQVIDVAFKAKFASDGSTGDMDMSMLLRQSGDQQMMDMDMTLKANFDGRSGDARVWMMVEKDGDAYNVYARRELPTKTTTRTQSSEYGRDSLDEAELKELMSNSVSTSPEIGDYLADVEKLGAYEEDGAFIIEAVPSNQTIKRIMTQSGNGKDFDDASVEDVSTRLVVDKESYRPRQFTMDLKMNFSLDKHKGKVEFNVDINVRDEDVTLSVPDEAANAPEVDLERFMSN